MISETERKGKVAELKVEQRALELGLVLCKPNVPVRYDYILDTNGLLERVQVKYASGTDLRSTNSIRVRLEKCRISPKGVQRKIVYSSDEIDVVLAYIPQIDKIVRLEAEQFCGKRMCTINLDKKTKSGQTKGIKFVRDCLW